MQLGCLKQRTRSTAQHRSRPVKALKHYRTAVPKDVQGDPCRLSEPGSPSGPKKGPLSFLSAPAGEALPRLQSSGVISLSEGKATSARWQPVIWYVGGLG